jgi:hypothetical protein
MDGTLLGHFKDAMELLRPDGYYFTGTHLLVLDVDDIYQHVKQLTDLSEKLRIFPNFELDGWPATIKNKEPLHYAMMLCNEFQYIRKHNRATFTVADMVAVAKASKSLRRVHDAPDLAWALIVCPALLSDLAEAFEVVEDLNVFNDPNTTIRCQGGKLNCTSLLRKCKVRKPSSPAISTSATSSIIPETEPDPVECIYETPLCKDGEFTASRLLAAFMDVMVTCYWIEKRWISDVGMYDAAIPPTITMC